MNRKWGVACLIAIVLGVFAYSAFINVQRDEKPDAQKSVGRRDKNGQFKESDDVGRSSAIDQKRDSKTKPKRREGDKGDR